MTDKQLDKLTDIMISIEDLIKTHGRDVAHDTMASVHGEQEACVLMKTYDDLLIKMSS